MSDPLPKKISQQKSDIHYHITHLRVPFFEVDMGQALYHGNYFHLFELGREEMLKKIGFPYREFMNRQLHLTVIDTRCTFRKPLRYEDQIELHTAIRALGRRNISFTQLIYRSLDSEKGPSPNLELCTECRIDMVCVQFTGRVTLLPEDFRRVARAVVSEQ